MDEFRKSAYRIRRRIITPPIEDCKKVNITISLLDLQASDDSTIRIQYMNCLGLPDEYLANNEGTFLGAFCANINTGFALNYISGGATFNASNSSANITSDNCDI